MKSLIQGNWIRSRSTSAETPLIPGDFVGHMLKGIEVFPYEAEARANTRVREARYSYEEYMSVRFPSADEWLYFCGLKRIYPPLRYLAMEKNKQL